jgi:hypothetical protein
VSHQPPRLSRGRVLPVRRSYASSRTINGEVYPAYLPGGPPFARLPPLEGEGEMKGSCEGRTRVPSSLGQPLS